MSNLVDTVRVQVSCECCVKKCQQEGCRVSLSQAPHPFVLVDMDKPSAPAADDGKKCDFLFINKDWVAPIELKRGKANAHEIAPQLQAGALIAQRLIPDNANVKFRPVAVFGGGIKKHERTAFRKKANHIRFYQQRETIRLIKTGKRLVEALNCPGFSGDSIA